MSITTISSREFNQDISRAKREAMSGPVFITDRGKPAHVLLSVDIYNRLIHTGKNLIDMISDIDVSDIDLDTVLDRPRNQPDIVDFD